MRKKIGTLIFVLLIPTFAYAQNTWTQIFEGTSAQVYFLNGSFIKGFARNNQQYYLMKIKIVDKKKDTAIFQKAVIYADYCNKGEGKLELYNLDEKNFTSHDFIFGGGNLTSIVAEEVCKKGN